MNFYFFPFFLQGVQRGNPPGRYGWKGPAGSQNAGGGDQRGAGSSTSCLSNHRRCRACGGPAACAGETLGSRTGALWRGDRQRGAVRTPTRALDTPGQGQPSHQGASSDRDETAVEGPEGKGTADRSIVLQQQQGSGEIRRVPSPSSSPAACISLWCKDSGIGYGPYIFIARCASWAAGTAASPERGRCPAARPQGCSPRGC